MIIRSICRRRGLLSLVRETFLSCEIRVEETSLRHKFNFEIRRSFEALAPLASLPCEPCSPVRSLFPPLKALRPESKLFDRPAGLASIPPGAPYSSLHLQKFRRRRSLPVLARNV